MDVLRLLRIKNVGIALRSFLKVEKNYASEVCRYFNEMARHRILKRFTFICKRVSRKESQVVMLILKFTLYNSI